MRTAINFNKKNDAQYQRIRYYLADKGYDVSAIPDATPPYDCYHLLLDSDAKSVTIVSCHNKNNLIQTVLCRDYIYDYISIVKHCPNTTAHKLYEDLLITMIDGDVNVIRQAFALHSTVEKDAVVYEFETHWQEMLDYFKEE